MLTFEKCIPIILDHEGGSKYTETPNDPGGATKFGISLLFLGKLSLIDGDIDHDGNIDADDIKSLSESQAENLYHEYFWNPLNLDEIKNNLLSLHIFDHAVNAGNGTAVKILQKLVNADVDGKIGPNTISLVDKYSSIHNIVSDYANARKRFYDNIISLHPNMVKFRAGWYNRVNLTHF
jgi:lysozyme family protein